MRKLTKKYLAWNYLAVILLTTIAIIGLAMFIYHNTGEQRRMPIREVQGPLFHESTEIQLSHATSFSDDEKARETKTNKDKPLKQEFMYNYPFLILIPIICFVIWICLAPMFVGDLSKKKGLNAKFWFILTILTPLLSIIIEVFYFYSVLSKDKQMKLLDFSLLSISALLPIIMFITFLLYRSLKGLNWSNEIVAINTEDDEQIDISQIPDICPFCRNPNASKERVCEWCGSRIC